MRYEILNLNDPIQCQQVDSLSRTLAQIVTSDFNDQVTLLINGNRGSGKSYTGLELCTKIAQEIAKIKGGNPSKYFTLDNVAIIRLDRVLDIMQNLTQYGVYFLDDIGVGYSNREWRSEKNIRMNKVIQTFRTDNVATILSVPDKGMIDKVPRELIDKYMETDKKYNMYSIGLNMVKVFNIERLLRENKMLEILPVIEQMDGMHQYAKYVVRRPNESITAPYEKLRRQIAQDLRKEEAAAIKAGEVAKQEAQLPKPTKENKTSRTIQVREEWEAKHKGKIFWEDYAQQNGLNPDSASVVLAKHKKKRANKSNLTN